jgi:hypothetical protein
MLLPHSLIRLSGLLFLLLLAAIRAHAQTVPSQNEITDSLYVQEVEDRHEPDKVLHAEPLFIDLIRDLGARKGEQELNVGLGLTDNNTYDEYTALVEYEWAPVNRLGLEVELPFSLYYPTAPNADAPGSRLQSLKVAAQYTFLVSEKHKTSLAVGYIHEFELPEFRRYGRDRLHQANHYNPFFVAAKRWGTNFHTLLYTGPVIGQFLVDGVDEGNSPNHAVWQINTNFHYMIPGTRNFIGVELNKEVTGRDFDLTIRPQMRVDVTRNLLIGIVTGIPINRENQRFSSFLRLIYEPGHGHR